MEATSDGELRRRATGNYGDERRVRGDLAKSDV
jgi:hypothetical protein